MSKQLTVEVDYGTEYTLSSQSELSTLESEFKRDGYVISSWNTASDGSGTEYPIESNLTAIEDIDLYAMWQMIEAWLSLTYDTNYDSTLTMVGTNGNSSKFEKEDLADPLVYVNSNGNVQAPFAGDANVGSKESLAQAIDSNYLVSQIGSYAFYYCSSLASANFPACQTIGSFAFRSCASLQSASFPACQTIGSYAFATCTSLQLASFPACQTIGSYAFSHCSNLASANFPACQTIGSFAFRSCASLQSASFPACQMIDEGAFRYCSSLASASFPACQTISSYAFHYCTSLQSARFPACQTIDEGAFYSCSSLASLYLMSTSVVSLASTDAFNYSPLSQGGSGTIYVPSSLVTAYKAATNWSVLAARISGI